MFDRIIFWLELRCRWNQLKTLGGSSLVRASVLMPAFGYMLLLNDNVHQYLTVKYDGWLLNYVPNVWRIWLLFYGSFFLAIATIVYSYYCPPEIKRYSSGFEMADGEAEHQHNMTQEGMVRSAVKYMFEKRPHWMKEVLTLPLGMNFDVPVDYSTSPTGALSRFLILQWNIRNLQHRPIRIALFLLFSMGLTLIAIPAAVTFLQVTALPFRHFL